MLGLVVAGSLAVLVAAVSAVGTLITAVAALRQGRRNTKAVVEVHQIVNSKNDALKDRVEQLALALQDAGVRIPRSPEAKP
jgi:hypothetical protein